MGTQQILLIVLSVIIVGAAIAVGIQMFNSQAYSANKSAIASDAQSFATQVVQFYKTPLSQGGAGKDGKKLITADIASYIGWGSNTTVDNDNGYYTILSDGTDTTEATIVTITGIGKEKNGSKIPTVVTTFTIDGETITAEVGDNGTIPSGSVPMP